MAEEPSIVTNHIYDGTQFCMTGKIKTVTITREVDEWYVTLSCEVDAPAKLDVAYEAEVLHENNKGIYVYANISPI
jgi:hypothetical protein